MKKPKTPCKHPLCPELVDHPGYCKNHQATMGYVSNEWHHLYNSTRWRKDRITYLSKHPLCVECKKEGHIAPATDVDHRIPHRGDIKLFFDQSNWQGLCEGHHGAKTARETGIANER